MASGNLISEAMREARRILVDEGPQPRETLIQRVSPLVRPNLAFRKYKMRNTKGKGTNKFGWTDEQMIASGARTIIDGSLHSAEQRGFIERSVKDGVVYYSITDWGRAQFERYYRRGEK